MALARDDGMSGALFKISGSVPTNATWSEDVYFNSSGVPTDISGMDWKMTFRCAEGNNFADFTISTSDYLSVQTDATSGVAQILRFAVPAGTLNAYSGDFIADLASKDGSNNVTLWGHGVIHFVYNPVSF